MIATCQSLDRNRHTLLYCLFYYKWDHNSGNDVILCLRRLETRNWDRKLIRRLFTEVIISGEENVNRRHWLHVLDQRSLSMFIQSMVQCKHLLLSCMTCCSCRLAFNTRFCSLFSNPMFSGSKLWASDTDTGLSRHCFTEILADFLHCHSSRKWEKKSCFSMNQVKRRKWKCGPLMYFFSA